MKTGVCIGLMCLSWASVQGAPGYREKGYLHLSPVPEAPYVAPETGILVRISSFSPALLYNLSTCIRATGDKTGLHSGVVQLAADKRTIHFRPSMAFARGEAVTVDMVAPEH
jgi:hypothetical protein